MAQESCDQVILRPDDFSLWHGLFFCVDRKIFDNSVEIVRVTTESRSLKSQLYFLLRRSRIKKN